MTVYQLRELEWRCILTINKSFLAVLLKMNGGNGIKMINRWSANGASGKQRAEDFMRCVIKTVTIITRCLLQFRN